MMAHSLSSLQIDYTKIPPRSGLLEQRDAVEPELPGWLASLVHVNYRPGYPSRSVA